MTIGSPHECDLFLLSGYQSYFANKALAEFAVRGARNMDGWGIAGYHHGRANVLRSADPALKDRRENLSREFYMAARAVTSPIILGHLRKISVGARSVDNNHPFKLNFLGYDWTMVHNGTARSYENLVPSSERLLRDSDNDSARIFEFLRARIISYYRESSRRRSRAAVKHMRSCWRLQRANSISFYLTAGSVLFLFTYVPFTYYTGKNRWGMRPWSLH